MRIRMILGLACLVLVSAMGFGQRISYDFDKSADFSKYRTYTWAESGGELNDSLTHRRIVNAIDLQMSAKGFVKVERGSAPDVVVEYRTVFSRALNVNAYSSGIGGFRFAPSRNGSARAEEFLVVTLAVNIVDVKTNQLLWRGTATKDVEMGASPEKRDKNINKAAEKLFKSFPPEK